jgi:DNA-binding XRE family transcriptional regulator
MKRRATRKKKRRIDMKKLDWVEIGTLPTADDMLNNKYVEDGSGRKDLFKKEAYSYYIGKIIEEARKEANMTQSELAEKVGSNKSYISRVETGRTEPKISTFFRIIAALGLSIELKKVGLMNV